MSERVEVRPGAYHDSVTLLQVSRVVAQVEGVTAAQVAMATDLNVEVLRRMSFDVPADAGANDLVVALRTVDEEALAAADEAVARELAGGRGAAAGVGVRHCLGVGGRDLSSAVLGASARQALRLLDADPGTDLVVLVGKPPAPEVEAVLAEVVADMRTPVLTALLGAGKPDLTAAVA